MLADGEDEGVVKRNVGALRLSNVKVMALSVRSGMKREERIWRVRARVDYWETQCQRVRVQFVGVLRHVSKGLES